MALKNFNPEQIPKEKGGTAFQRLNTKLYI